MQLCLATSNPHKVEEVQAVLGLVGIDVVPVSTLLPPVAEPVEDAPTFTGNAVIKASYYARRTGRLCLADDSGLVVDALCGAPGVFSARFAGVGGSRAEADAANNAKLLSLLAGVDVSRRTARFVCVMALCDAHRSLAVARGTIEGRVVDTPRGANGFGYDPLFEVPALGRTTAELDGEHKNRISHRGRALVRLVKILENNKGRLIGGSQG